MMIPRRGFIPTPIDNEYKVSNNRDKFQLVSGFTLIELLVVVAIIGVLAGIVLTALGSARDKAKDSKIKSLMVEMRNQAELFAIEHGNYHGANTVGWGNDDISECRSSGIGGDGTLLDPTMSESITDIIFEVHKISTLTGFTRIYCGVGRPGLDSWAFAAPLYQPEAGTTGWCIDSSGNSKAVNFDFTVSTGPAAGGGSVKAQCP